MPHNINQLGGYYTNIQNLNTVIQTEENNFFHFLL